MIGNPLRGHASSQKLDDSSNNSKTALLKAGTYEDTLYIYINFIWINYCSCYIMYICRPNIFKCLLQQPLL